jgi:adenine-specific DNA glycosylase
MDFGSLICNAKPKCEKCIFNKKCTSYTKNLLTNKQRKRTHYIGSNRFFRGKILFILRRTKNNKIKETKLKQKIKDYNLNETKYKKIISELEKDELISMKRNYIYLGNYNE